MLNQKNLVNLFINLPPMQADFITLKNNLITVTITNYGARIVSLITDDKNGNPVDVVAGFKSVEEYVKSAGPYYGATIGRFANRIAKGQFSLNGKTYQLPVNNGQNSLHGGSGFNSKIWTIAEVSNVHIIMRYTSADGEDGYPGKLQVTVTFSLNGDTLKIDYKAAANADTIINLTNHAYFNLNGEGSGSITGHTLLINADAYTPINANLIPTGEMAAVADTPFDFREEKIINERIDNDVEQLAIARGYDHNYVLNKPADEALSFAAKAVGDLSGIAMETFTTEPGIQLYTGNFMNGLNTFKSGAADGFRTCFCLETQHFPNSPNEPSFPNVVLKPGELFTSATHYRFGLSV